MRSLIYILIILVSFTGCSKKWKKTSETTFDVEFQKSKASVNYLMVEKGDFYLTEFTLKGNRKRGGDVVFSENFTSPLVFDIESSTSSPALQYDIPQGEYTNMEITFRFDIHDTIGAMLIYGSFKDSSELEMPFVFELEDRIDINVIAISSSGDNVVVNAEENTKPIVFFDLIDWFEHIPFGLLDEADTEEEDMEEILRIDKINNPSLYALILDRIGQTVTVTF